ncbi:hypothetical protein ACVIGB_001485 [Bradyrhizobium sp. USDA 4341]
MDKSVELTDPATELADLVERLRPTKRMPTGLEAFAGVMVAQNDAIFVDLLPKPRAPLLATSAARALTRSTSRRVVAIQDHGS